MKHIKWLILCFLFVIAGTVTVFAANTIAVEINGQRVLFSDQQPLIKDSRTLVPVRGIFEQLGYNVNWDNGTQTATISNGIYTVNITRGKSEFSTNGKTFQLDVPAQIINGRMMLPFRAILESVGYNVGWDGNRYVVIITSNNMQMSETYYTEFTTVLNFGTYANISYDQVTKTTENNVLVYKYNRAVVTTEQIKAYADELVKLGFIIDNTAIKVGYSIYTKDNISVSIDLTTKEYVIIRLQGIAYTTVVENNYSDYPHIPDIGFFSNPQNKFDKATKTIDGKTYWYKGITTNTIQIYIDELVRLGYKKDNVNSKTGYYVCIKGDNTIIIDTVTYKVDGYILIIIKINVNYFADYPSVPSFPENLKRTTPTSEGNGTNFWYLNVNTITIDNYIKLLTNHRFTKDTPKSKSGYYVYVKDEITIIIDSVNYKNDGYIVIIIKVTVSYLPDYPSVPSMPEKPQRITPTDDNDGTNYWYLNLTEATVQNYIKLLVRLGFTNDTSKTKNGYYVYIKGDTTIIIDTITYTKDGYTLMVIKKIVKSKTTYLPDYPTVPVFGVPNKTTVSDDGNGTVYWYLNVKDATVQDYIKLLIELGFTYDKSKSKNGYYVYVKGDATVIIDTVSNVDYVLITVKKTALVSTEYYTHFPQIPTVGIKHNSFAPTEDVLGYIYWYTVIEKSAIENYVNVLRSLGFTINLSSSYYVCVKENITITVDAVSVTIKDISKAKQAVKYYTEFPAIPQIEGTIISTESINNGLGYIYRYRPFDKSIMQRFVSVLAELGFTVSQNDNSGYYNVLTKDDITITTQESSITIEKKSSIPQNTVGYYNDYPIVPDFAYVVKDYWTIASDHIEAVDGRYSYRISTANGGMQFGNNYSYPYSDEAAKALDDVDAPTKNDYRGSTNLFDVYIDALIKDGFVQKDIVSGDVINLNSQLTEKLFVKGNVEVKVGIGYYGPFRTDVSESRYIFITINQ